MSEDVLTPEAAPVLATYVREVEASVIATSLIHQVIGDFRREFLQTISR